MAPVNVNIAIGPISEWWENSGARGLNKIGAKKDRLLA
jgi:hypothetical protein